MDNMATQETTHEIIPPEHTQALARVSQSDQDSLVLMPVMNLQVAKQRLDEFQGFVKGYMVEGEDYGKIPGVAKPSLFKPGAEKLKELYGLTDTYPEDRIRRVENFDTGFFFYEVTCVLTSKKTGAVVAEGKGSCNSFESRYRFRNAERKCPKCHKEAIIKGKEEYGGGWLCWKKKNGCGAQFDINDPAILGQEAGKVENDNFYDVMNTILKMACKRAMVPAVISATRSSGIFTQDVEDGSPSESNGHGHSRVVEAPLRHDVISGHIEEISQNAKGVLSFTVKVKGNDKPAICAVDPKRQELSERLSGAQGDYVELNCSKHVVAGGKDKGKLYYEVLSLIDIRRPEPSELEITDEDIPF
jgi:hypothetical protein